MPSKAGEISITLVRRGQSSGSKLLPEGWYAARIKGLMLREIVPLSSYVKFYSSPFKCAMQTTCALAEAFYPVEEVAREAGVVKKLEQMKSKELAEVLAKVATRVRERIGLMGEISQKELQKLTEAMDKLCSALLESDKNLRGCIKLNNEAVEKVAWLCKQVKAFSKKASRALTRPMHLVIVTHAPLIEALIKCLTGEETTIDNLEHVTLKIRGDEAELHFREEKILVRPEFLRIN